MSACTAIRASVDGDVPAMLDVIRAAFEQYRGKLDPPSSAERKDAAVLRAELACGGALVAERAGEILGCILWAPRGEDLRFARLSVLPEHRNQGIGAKLVDAVEVLARANARAGVTLSVRLQLRSPQRWYASRGYAFVRYGIHEGYAEPTNMLMRKPLPRSPGASP